MAVGAFGKSGGQVRYLTANSTASAFTLAAGRTTTRPANMLALGQALGAEFTFFGTGNADTTFDVRCWAIKGGRLRDSENFLDYERSLLWYATCTLGTGVGAAASGAPILSSETLCDTVVMTVASGSSSAKGPGAAVQGAWSAADFQSFSPADNTFGRVICRDLGQCLGIELDFDMTGATSGNALVELIMP